MASTGVLLFDGASRKRALVWLSKTYPEHSLSPLLYGTQFEALGDVGPILLDADEGSLLQKAWFQGSPDLQYAVWLKTEKGLPELYTSLRRRLRVYSPDGREFWLRLADSRPLLRASEAKVQWPEGFWHGVSEVWLQRHGRAFKAWENQTPEHDCTCSAEDINAQITLEWPLLEALAQESESSQEAAL